jgi:hypothetical protein
MSSTTTLSGRLGNRFFINVAASLLAEKHNLFIVYEHGDDVNPLFPLFVGTNRYTTTVSVKDENYVDLFNKDTIDSNLYFHDYFQSTKVTMLTHKYIHSKLVHRTPYQENNDCFIHVRLGDVAKWNPGVAYYQGILSTLKVDRVYLTTDSKDHTIVQTLMQDPKITYYEGSPIDTILFAASKRYVILSHGTFSGMIGYLAFHSTVYFVKENETTSWDYFGGNGKFNLFEGKYTKRGKFIGV